MFFPLDGSQRSSCLFCEKKSLYTRCTTSEIFPRAHRFLAARLGDRTVDLVTILPPPPIYARVSVLEWSAERLAQRLGASYAPMLFAPTAPVGKHPDLVDRLPVIPVEFYDIVEPITFRDKTVLLVDWRWHKGRMLTILARRLFRAGARVVRFAWLA